VTIITRADKGVEWTVDPTLKMYDEKPLAFPYTKDEAGSASDAEAAPKGVPEATADDCDGEFTKVGTKTIAGFAATGYKMGCKGRPGGMITWMSPDDATWKRAEKELNEFNKAKQAALFANYPAKEKKEFEEGADLLKSLMGTAMALKGIRAPKGVPLALESEGENAGLMYEAETVNFSGADPSLFEVPAGFQRVDNLAVEQASKMTGIDIKKMYAEMGDMPRQAVNDAEPGGPEPPAEEASSPEEPAQEPQPAQVETPPQEPDGVVYQD
jgi:hypothetical protein